MEDSERKAIFWRYSAVSMNGGRSSGKTQAKTREEAIGILTKMGYSDISVSRDDGHPIPPSPDSPLPGFQAKQVVMPMDLPPPPEPLKNLPPTAVPFKQEPRPEPPPPPRKKRRESIVFGNHAEVRSQAEPLLANLGGVVRHAALQPNVNGIIMILLVIEHDPWEA